MQSLARPESGKCSIGFPFARSGGAARPRCERANAGVAGDPKKSAKVVAATPTIRDCLTDDHLPAHRL